MNSSSSSNHTTGKAGETLIKPVIDELLKQQ
jgi:hypothetical protein